MFKKARVVLRLAGLGLIAAGAFGGLAAPWPLVLLFIGLAAMVFSGGFG